MDPINRRQFISGALAGAGALALLPHDARADFYIRSRQVAGRNHVYLSDVAAYYGMKLQRQGDAFIMASKDRRLELQLNRRKALVNGVVIDLGFAPREHQATALITEIDLGEHLDPILRPWAQPRQSVNRIVIDPGHGDHDPGAQGDRHREKDVVLAISQRLHRALTARGYEVVMTRSTDTFLELGDRPTVAARQRADLFLSIHVNSSGKKNSDPNGIETFFATPRGLPASGQTDPESGTVDGNRFDGLNLRLAYDLHRYLIGNTGANDRGLKRMRWRVLKTAPCPSALLELGFLTNRAEERRLGTASYQERLAEAMASGVVSYHRVTAARS